MQLDLEELISLQEDTHANHSVKQVGDKAKKMNVISGQKCYELSKVANHDTFWLKMLLVMSQWASTKCLLTWKIKDTPQGRLLYQLVPKTHHIDETEFGSSDNMWATPNTMDHLPQRSEEATLKMQNGHRKGRSKPSNLREQVNPDTMKMWPTPTAGDHSRNTVPPSIGKTRGYDLSMKVVEEEQKKQEQMWPTPRSSNLMNQQMTPELANRNKGNLEEVVAERMWPTPTASDVEGGVAKDVQTANGRFFRQNEKGEKWGVKLRDAVNHTEEKKLWPTPAARDHKGGYIGGRYKNGKPNNNTLDTQVQFVSNQKKEQKQLSANWVTWLMGYPQGYLDILTENQNTSQELQKEKKTEPKS